MSFFQLPSTGEGGTSTPTFPAVEYREGPYVYLAGVGELAVSMELHTASGTSFGDFPPRKFPPPASALQSSVVGYFIGFWNRDDGGRSQMPHRPRASSDPESDAESSLWRGGSSGSARLDRSARERPSDSSRIQIDPPDGASADLWRHRKVGAGGAVPVKATAPNLVGVVSVKASPLLVVMHAPLLSTPPRTTASDLDAARFYSTIVINHHAAPPGPVSKAAASNDVSGIRKALADGGTTEEVATVCDACALPRLKR